ncbi:MAG: hypothetical protein NT035_05755 [Burkholderiales bacterium]|nr:hypothetical protein [Burkholderiales bacterium]
MQSAKRLDCNHVAALRVRDAAAVCFLSFAAIHFVLVHSIKVGNEQQSLAQRATTLCHEVSGSAKLGLIHPAGLEPERLHFGGIQGAQALNPFVVFCGTRDVDGAREQINGGLAPLIDVGDKLLLDLAQICRLSATDGAYKQGAKTNRKNH